MRDGRIVILGYLLHLVDTCVETWNSVAKCQAAFCTFWYEHLDMLGGVTESAKSKHGTVELGRVEKNTTLNWTLFDVNSARERCEQAVRAVEASSESSVRER